MSIEKAAIENPTPRGTGVTTLIHGKDARLSVLSAAPIVLETPHSLLAELLPGQIQARHRVAALPQPRRRRSQPKRLPSQLIGRNQQNLHKFSL